MTPKGMKSQIEERYKSLELRMERLYEKVKIGEWTCFVRPDGSLFTLEYIIPYGALVIGYADNEEEAKLNRFEDGDLFYLEDMDEETMFNAMIQEIQQ